MYRICELVQVFLIVELIDVLYVKYFDYICNCKIIMLMH